MGREVTMAIDDSGVAEREGAPDRRKKDFQLLRVPTIVLIAKRDEAGG